MVLSTVCPGWLRTWILLISASWIARILEVCHLAIFYFLNGLIDKKNYWNFLLNSFELIRQYTTGKKVTVDIFSLVYFWIFKMPCLAWFAWSRWASQWSRFWFGAFSPSGAGQTTQGFSEHSTRAVGVKHCSGVCWFLQSWHCTEGKTHPYSC
jgi:hypothetical protein